jgi:hypothetical protein
MSEANQTTRDPRAAEITTGLDFPVRIPIPLLGLVKVLV